MRRASWTVALTLTAGCFADDRDCLARVARKIAAKAHAATSQLADLAPAWPSPGLRESCTLEARVAARLNWDQALAGANIEVMGEGATVRLYGTVVDAAQQRRAVELAESTVGVARVVDHLTLRGVP
ncbi:MAG: BON domain-containing protein [Gemmataceae bacterium]|nr:BON domain-containing protein [Gemmataceae bacterium]